MVFDYPNQSGIKGETWTGTLRDNLYFEDDICGDCWVIFKAPNQYRTSGCHIRILISNSCPTDKPTSYPTGAPTNIPTDAPTNEPTVPTSCILSGLGFDPTINPNISLSSNNKKHQNHCNTA